MSSLRWRVPIILVLLGMGLLARLPMGLSALAGNIGQVYFGRVAFSSWPLPNADSARYWMAWADQFTPSSELSAKQKLLGALTDSLPFGQKPLQANTDKKVVELWASLVLAVSFADQADRQGASQPAKVLRSAAGELDQALSQSPQRQVILTGGWQSMYRLIALSQKVERPDLIEIWLSQVRLAYPDPGFSYLYVLSDPYAQTELSESYASLGLMDDALRVGEQALEIHNWEWGHFLIAGHYRKLKRWDDAERHLLAAINVAANESATARYRLALVEVYQAQDKRDLAIKQLCQVLLDQAPPQFGAEARLKLIESVGTIDVCGGIN